MVWDPEDIKGQTHSNIMECFVSCADYSRELQVVQGQDCYRVNIKKPLNLSMAIYYLWVGLSFHRAVPELQSTKERSRIATISFSNDTMILKYAQIICAISLQKGLKLPE